MSPREVRVACVQLTPAFKDVRASIARADKLVSEIAPGSVDIVVLPEMAFTGYNFASYDDAASFAEDSVTGPTFSWASPNARRLGAYVFVGFPQRLPASDTINATAIPDRPTLHNSLMIVSPAGELVATYAKHHLFDTDESWATPGPSFTTVDLAFPESSAHYPTREGPGEVPTFRVCPAICMDLNPDHFTAPWSLFECATYAQQHNADLVICSMAWLVSEGEPPRRSNDKWEQVQSVLGYWAARLGPLLGTGAGFVAANRVGTEGDATFTGSSCAMSLTSRGVDVHAFGAKEGEEVVRATIELAK